MMCLNMQQMYRKWCTVTALIHDSVFLSRAYNHVALFILICCNSFPTSLLIHHGTYSASNLQCNISWSPKCNVQNLAFRVIYRKCQTALINRRVWTFLNLIIVYSTISLTSLRHLNVCLLNSLTRVSTLGVLKLYKLTISLLATLSLTDW